MRWRKWCLWYWGPVYKSFGIILLFETLRSSESQINAACRSGSTICCDRYSPANGNTRLSSCETLVNRWCPCWSPCAAMADNLKDLRITQVGKPIGIGHHTTIDTFRHSFRQLFILASLKQGRSQFAVEEISELGYYSKPLPGRWWSIRIFLPAMIPAWASVLFACGCCSRWEN